jgi:DNA polymerase-3 subunit delta'
VTPEPRENPQLFGHEGAEATFERAVAAGRMHHAWLITGPAGVGKATLAYRLARRLLALGDPNDPANPVFRRLAAGSHADVLSIERELNEKTKKLKTAIAVEQTRAISGFMHLTAAEGGWRVVVIDGADDMNANAANALLKILEEPSRRGILLLTADAPGRLLPTIRSRCRRLQLNPLDDASMDRALQYLLPDMAAGERQALGRVAEGAPGQAVLLAGEGALALSALVDQVLAEAPRLSVLRMHDVADRATKTETGFSTFMTLLQSGLGKAVRGAAARGDGNWGGGRPLAEWGEVWHGLGRLLNETERFNLDKRTAVIAGLELLSAS